jgi:tetratricopeptide (TPR) repeat protein
MVLSMTQASSLAKVSPTGSLLARLAAVLALFVLVLGASGCSKLRARDLLNKGVQSFKNGQYDVAIDDFQKAKDLDPTLMNARLYLATAYATQYIPGAPSQENMNFGNQAIKVFKEVLESDPNNLSAIDGIGSILFQMAGTPFDPAKFDESKTYHQKHIALQPNDPEPYYWIGVIDWTLAFRANAVARADYNKDHINKQVKEAIELRPDYDDAMAYLNLLYRRKADTVESADERASLIKQADALIDQVKEIKQKRADQPQPAAS